MQGNGDMFTYFVDDGLEIIDEELKKRTEQTSQNELSSAGKKG